MEEGLIRQSLWMEQMKNDLITGSFFIINRLHITDISGLVSDVLKLFVDELIPKGIIVIARKLAFVRV